VRNLLVPAWLGVFACIITMLFHQRELALFLSVCTLLSGYCAVAWQSVKLQASELQQLVPGFKRVIVGQSLLVLASLYVPLLLIASFYHDTELLLSLALGGIVGSGFWWYCRRNGAAFRYVSLLFFVVAVLAAWLNRVPDTWLLPAWILHTLVLIATTRGRGADNWTQQALYIYQRGLNSGWSPIHSQESGRWTQQLNQRLFPVSFFFGSTIGLYLSIYAVAALFAVILNRFIDIKESATFIAANFILLLFYLLHWTRVQRHRSWEQLYLLPLYASRTAMQDDFVRVTERLCLGVLPISFVFAYLLYLPQQLSDALEVLSYALSLCASCLLCNAISNLCQKSYWLGLVYVVTLLALALALYWATHVPIYWRLAGMSLLLLLSFSLHRASARRLFTAPIALG